jgi:hypothetical protein
VSCARLGCYKPLGAHLKVHVEWDCPVGRYKADCDFHVGCLVRDIRGRRDQWPNENFDFEVLEVVRA